MSPFGQIDTITASLQADVGTFLGLRSKLLEMTKSPLLTISGKATTLLNTQTDLENRLSGVNQTIDTIKGGAYAVSDILSVGEYLYEMETQISSVNDLYNQYTGTAGAAVAPGSSWLWIGAAGLAAWWFLFRRRRK